MAVGMMAPVTRTMGVHVAGAEAFGLSDPSDHSGLRGRVPPHDLEAEKAVLSAVLLDNSAVSRLFLAAAEATEEAILDSLFTATTTEGFHGTVAALPVEKVLELAVEGR